MAQNEDIKSKQYLPLFRQLKNDGIILHMTLHGSFLEKLTVVSQIKTSKTDLYMVVDCPEGYKEAVEKRAPQKIDFSFIGKDGIPYRFTTNRGRILEDGQLLIKFPRTVECIHRRRHFRIPTPAGASLTANLNGEKYTLSLIDISQGGALATFAGENRHRKILKEGQELTDIRLRLFKKKSEDQPVTIRRAEIKRVVMEKNTEAYHYGLMFKEITDYENQRLKDQIYVNQRQMLRKRRASS